MSINKIKSHRLSEQTRQKIVNIKRMTTEQVMDIKDNHEVVWDYYVSTLKAFDGYFSLYLNKETGEIFESYEASQNTWLKGDDIVRICGTSALCDDGLNKNQIDTFEMWCDEWFNEWFKEFFEPALADAIRYI